MPNGQLHARAIAGLVEYFGGYALVAAILNVRVADLQGWAAGRAHPPSDACGRMAHLAGDLSPEKIVTRSRL
ncbi:MAG: hypothetical protein ACREF6_06670 [Alphaproteobacteria bacterium]